MASNPPAASGRLTQVNGSAVGNGNAVGEKRGVKRELDVQPPTPSQTQGGGSAQPRPQKKRRIVRMPIVFLGKLLNCLIGFWHTTTCAASAANSSWVMTISLVYTFVPQGCQGHFSVMFQSHFLRFYTHYHILILLIIPSDKHSLHSTSSFVSLV